MLLHNDSPGNGVERQFDIHSVRMCQKFISDVVEQNFKGDIENLEGMVGLHIKLLGYLLRYEKIKRELYGYDKNIVLSATLVDHIYLPLSILDLLKKGYYGSARVLLRQSFEMLMIAKCSEYSKDLREKWHEGKVEMRDVWYFLKNDKSRDLYDKLNPLYKELCKYVHSTPFAQQIPILPTLSNDDVKNERECKAWLEQTDFISHTRYTIDIFFVTLNMLFHLDNLFHKKVKSYYTDPRRDFLKDHSRVKSIKDSFKTLKEEYFSMLKSKGLRRTYISRWKKIIYLYRLDWGKLTRL